VSLSINRMLSRLQGQALLLGALAALAALIAAGRPPTGRAAGSDQQPWAFLPAVWADEPSVAPSPDGVWREANEAALADVQIERAIFPDAYRVVAANLDRLHARLRAAEEAPAGDPPVLWLPLPGGGYAPFTLRPDPIMAPELASRYPAIRTFAGRNMESGAAAGAIARLDLTPHGFHAMILAEGETIFVDPYSRADVVHYLVYRARDAGAPSAPPEESLREIVEPNAAVAEQIGAAIARGLGPVGDELRVYRLAVAATGEYTQFHGGAIEDALAAIVTAVNRVTGIYQREVAVRLQLVAENDAIIYTDPASDPYTSDNISLLLLQNQGTLDDVIGPAGYDVGHLFTTGAGGQATLGVVCRDGQKARGATGLPEPVGDPFYVDYVAHELGHQFGATHTYNGTAGYCSFGRNEATAYEPGSGSTIMGYAGLCGDQNLQNHSDDVFHAATFDQIVAYTTAGDGASCAAVAPTGNAIPTADAGADYTIPAETPFTLGGAGSDDDGDPLLYSWEELDLGPAGPPNNPLAPPYFRSWTPIIIPERTFPRLADLLQNRTALGEQLPVVTDTLTFRLTARDNRGGVAYDTMQLTVDGGSGPFRVTEPAAGTVWEVGRAQAVTWDVAGTAGPPVNCSRADVLLSRDGGRTFPLTLAAGTANDGGTSVVPPDAPSGNARIKIACAGNVFFDVSDDIFPLLPRADAGGPYVTDEGAPVTLDAGGSSAADAYQWDLDGDGAFDDAVGTTVLFNAVGQDGVQAIGLRVVVDGLSNTDHTTVTVRNVAPSLALAANAPVTEGATVTVTGVISDPGWLEPLTATVAWDGGEPQALDGALENEPPAATLTFAVAHRYGDDGAFAAEVCVADDDATACATVDLPVMNAAPAANVDAAAALDVGGMPTVLGAVGEPLALVGRVTDPGSDDVTLRWEWGDGSPVVATLYPANPPDPDPSPSPELGPRDVTEEAAHTYAAASRYQVRFWAEDDDGGVSEEAQVAALVLGPGGRARHAGYWQHQFLGTGAVDFDEETLLSYLTIVDHFSAVFSRTRDAGTIPAAYDVLFLGENGGSAAERLDRELLTAWLNVAHGALGYQDEVDVDGDGEPDGSLGEIVATAEAVRGDPAATAAALRAQIRIVHRLNNP